MYINAHCPSTQWLKQDCLYSFCMILWVGLGACPDSCLCLFNGGTSIESTEALTLLRQRKNLLTARGTLSRATSTLYRHFDKARRFCQAISSRSVVTHTESRYCFVILSLEHLQGTTQHATDRPAANKRHQQVGKGNEDSWHALSSQRKHGRRYYR
jgi:hypothetical protein